MTVLAYTSSEKQDDASSMTIYELGKTEKIILIRLKSIISSRLSRISEKYWPKNIRTCYAIPLETLIQPVG
jgi:hypothetical protein